MQFFKLYILLVDVFHYLIVYRSNELMRKLIIILISFIVTVHIGTAQPVEKKLQWADSLFQQKKYTESFNLYEELLYQQELVSPSMLAKMAFIQEGLGDYSQALYFLNLYYLETANKAVLKKMEKLAEEHNLSGYEYTDMEFFLSIYHKYFLEIAFAFLLIAIIILAVIFYQKKRYKYKPIGYAIFYVILLAGLFFLINFGNNYKKGIINVNDSYLMSAPSAGAKLIDVVDKGHRVKIIGKEDVWVKIKWNNKIAFIRDNHLIKI